MQAPSLPSSPRPSLIPGIPTATTKADPATGTTPDGRRVLVDPKASAPSCALQPPPERDGEAAVPRPVKRRREDAHDDTPQATAEATPQATPLARLDEPGIRARWRQALELVQRPSLPPVACAARQPDPPAAEARTTVLALGSQLAATAGASPRALERLVVESLETLNRQQPWLGELNLLAPWLLEGARLLPLGDEAVLAQLLTMQAKAEVLVPSSAGPGVDTSQWTQVRRLCAPTMSAVCVTLLLRRLEDILSESSNGSAMKWLNVLGLAQHLAAPVLRPDQAAAIAIGLRRITRGNAGLPALAPGNPQPWANLLPAFHRSRPGWNQDRTRTTPVANAWPVEVVDASCRLVIKELDEALATPGLAATDATRWPEAAMEAMKAILGNLQLPGRAQAEQTRDQMAPRLAALAPLRASWIGELAALRQHKTSSDPGQALNLERLIALIEWHDQRMRLMAPPQAPGPK